MSTLHFTTTVIDGEAPGPGQWLDAERAIGKHFDDMNVQLTDEQTGNMFEYLPQAHPVLWTDPDDLDAATRRSECFLSFAGDPSAWSELIGQAWIAYSATFDVEALGVTYRVDPLFFEARGETFPDQTPPVVPPVS